MKVNLSPAARAPVPISKASSLTTENVIVQQAGDDVYVEQLSTIVDGSSYHVSMVFLGGGWAHHRRPGAFANDRGPSAG